MMALRERLMNPPPPEPRPLPHARSSLLSVAVPDRNTLAGEKGGSGEGSLAEGKPQEKGRAGMWTGILAMLALLGVSFNMAVSAEKQPLLPAVEVEEGVYTYAPADNGAGPLWCYGSTCLVRIGEDVFAAGLETLKDRKPLNNCRWLLFKRTDQGWKLIQADPNGRTREPCPLVGFPDGRLFLSANPTLTAPDAANGPAQPQVLQFSARAPAAPFTTMVPPWEGKPAFTEHSYRSFAADGPGHELVLFNVLGYDMYHWSLMDRTGQWPKQGKLVFPIGTEYEKPEPIRLCYPEIAVRDRAVHFLGISDIIEPVKAWREYKLELNKGRHWDYDFRRLFYTYTPDITTTPFATWVEVASREKTAGHITNLDLWLDKEGRAHLLWLEQSLWDLRLREKFFPGVPLTYSLEHAVMDKGKVVQRTTLAAGGEGLSKEIPGYGRLHATPDGRLFAFYYCSGTDAQGRPLAENRLMEIYADGTHGEPARVPLEHPFTSFMTATERGGSPPSDQLEILGDAADRPGISYARIAMTNKIFADFTAAVQRTATGSRISLDGTGSRSAAGKVVAWDWKIDGSPVNGAKVDRVLDCGGAVAVVLTAKDDQGNAHQAAKTIFLPPIPADLGLKKWGLVLRTAAMSFTSEGGGTIQVRYDKLASSGLSLSQWNSKGHWLEWEADVPQADDYFLIMRYATPQNASRTLTLDGKPLPILRFAASGGYGSDVKDNWAFTVLADESGKPMSLRLSPGAHQVRLEDPNGTGLNVDYFEWIAKTTAAPTGKTLTAGEFAGLVLDEGGRAFVIPLRGTVSPSRLSHDGDFCYTTPLGNYYGGDGLKGMPDSTLRLVEDGKELGPAHVPHVDIRAKGNGRFSHWNTTIYFSASDNSDPRTNGRKYTWQITPQ